MSEETNKEQSQQPTEQEVRQMRDNMIKSYKEEIKMLKVQEEYERLVADIEEHKTRRLYNIIRMAQMKAGPEEEEEELEEPQAPQQGKRTLKED